MALEPIEGRPGWFFDTDTREEWDIRKLRENDAGWDKAIIKPGEKLIVTPFCPVDQLLYEKQLQEVRDDIRRRKNE